jgi:hypothetical protein
LLLIYYPEYIYCLKQLLLGDGDFTQERWGIIIIIMVSFSLMRKSNVNGILKYFLTFVGYALRNIFVVVVVHGT